MKRIFLIFALVAFLIPVGIGGSAQTAKAQPGVIWTSQFYNNPDVAGSPALVRQDNEISFNWGTGSPAPGAINADTFSARFTTNTYLQTGSYRFTVLADDGVRLYVNGSLLIDTFGEGQHGQTLAVDTYLVAGIHAIQLDYRENVREAFVYLSWSAGGTGGLPEEGLWSAQYFDNTTLSGLPQYTATEPEPSHFWGSTTPYFTISADSWSARWSSSQTLATGTYRITVRADDGVRVFVDGVAYVNEWHQATGQTYSVNLALNAGQHFFVVEFYEAQGAAFIDYNFEQVVTTPPQPPVTGAAVEITAYALRVRDEPSTVTGEILTHVQDGEVYPLLGQSADGVWYQINVFGTVGWVHGDYVDVVGADALPGVPPSPPVVSSALGEVTAFWLNMRTGPSTAFGVVGVLSRGTTVEVLGRNFDSSWLMVRTQNVTGWVSSNYIDLQAGITISQLPVQS